MITVKTPDEAIFASKLISNNFKLVRIINKILDPPQLILLNVIYANAIIGEIQIKLGKKPPHFYSAPFLFELSRCDTGYQFK